MDRQVSLVALPLLLVLALLVGTRSPPTSQSTAIPDTTSRGVLRSTAGFRGGRALLSEYFGRPFVDDQPCGGFGRSDGTCRLERVLIVGMPDPWGSRLDWVRDSYLEAVRRAIERTGYVLDRYVLPGPDTVAVDPSEGPRPLERATPGRGSPARSAGEPVEVRRVAFEPGVFLFREGTAVGAPGLVLVYAVHEIPTGGVYRRAFRSALAERAVLLGLDGGPGSTGMVDSLPVLGPAFSGSSPSYRLVLDDYIGLCPENTHVRIISGSATSRSNEAILERASTGLARRAAGPEAGSGAGARAQVGRDNARLVGEGVGTVLGPTNCPGTYTFDFAATVNPDDLLLRAVMERVLAPMRLCRVAILSESTTSYGRGFLGWEAGTSDGPGRCPARGADDPTLLTVPFPMNIARLRNVYASQSRTEPSPIYAPAPGEEQGIPLSLRTGGRASETPEASSQLTAAALDIVLREIMHTLRAHEIEAIGLMATDVRDKLFLSEQVRAHLPDVQLFTVESNVLLLSAQFNEHVRGMVVGSSYPMFAQNQWWVGSGPTGEARRLAESRVVFSHDNAVGVHNAALFLMDADSLAVEYASQPGLCDSHPAEWGPPVWLTTVGRREMLPLACVPGDRNYVYRPRTLTSPSGILSPRVPRSTLLYGAAVGLGVVLIALVLWVMMASREHSARSVDSAAAITECAAPSFERIKFASLHIHWHLYVGLLIAGILFLLYPAWLIVFPGHTPLHPGELLVDSERTLFFVLVWLVGFFVLAGLVLTVARGGRLAGRWTGEGLRYGVRGLERWILDAIEAGQSRWSQLERKIESSGSWMAAVRSEAKKRGQAGGGAARRSGPEEADGKGAASSGARLRARNPFPEYPIDPAFWLLEVVSRLGVLLYGLFLLGAVLSWGLGIENLNAGLTAARLVLLVQRMAEVGEGPSPILFLLLGGGGVVVWALWHLVRVNMLLNLTPFDDAAVNRAMDAALGAPGGNAGVPPPRGNVHSNPGPGSATDVSNPEPDPPSGAGVSNPESDGRSSTSAANRNVADGGEVDRTDADRPRSPRPWQSSWVDTLVAIRDVRWRLYLLVPDYPSLAFLVFVAAMGLWLFVQFEPTLEAAGAMPPWSRRAWHALLAAYVLGALGVTSWSVYRLWSVWRALHRAMIAMSETPLLAAFGRLPREIARVTRLTVFTTSSRNLLDRTGESQLAQLRAIYCEAVRTGDARKSPEPSTETRPVRRRIRAFMKGDIGSLFVTPGRSREDGEAVDHMWDALTRLWALQPDAEAQEKLRDRLGGDPALVTSTEIRQSASGWMGLWRRSAEEFLATQFMGYVDWALRHLRVLALFILAMILLTTGLLSSYPFVPQSIVKVSLFLIVIGAVSVFLGILVQLGRDNLMSRVNGTEPGKLNWNLTFVMNVTLFAIVPILAVLSSEFPGLRQTLFAWLGPLAQALGSF